MLRLIPFGAVIVLFGLFATSAFSPRIDALLTRISFLVFGDRHVDYDPTRERLLRAASIGTPYRAYVAKTRLYATGAGIGGAIIGVYAGAVVLILAGSVGIGGAPASTGWTLGSLPLDWSRFVALLGASAAFAVAAIGATNTLRWRIPAIRADARKREIEASLPRMVAFAYALTRGGMAVPEVLRTIADNERVFGESASAVGVAVRNIDLFSVDLVTAVQELADNSPSDQFGTFAENLSSVLQSGGNVSGFLHEQYERYRKEAEDQQAEILNLLATTAEVYVTVIVAGMLFLVTILLIIGLTAGETLGMMQVLAYVVIPAANLVFLAYLYDVTGPLRTSGTRTDGSRQRVPVARDRKIESDGGYSRPNSKPNHERLKSYRRLRSVRDTMAAPLQSLLDRPQLLFYLTVPIALVVTGIRIPSAVSGGGLDVRVLDDLLVQATIFLVGTYAVAYEYSTRRLRRLESALPDFLDRLASLNESGLSVISSFDRVRRSDIGALDEEAERIWRDVTWGSTAEEALSRFETRVRTPAVTRVVTLVRNAMGASNEIGPVLRIAAEQARSDLQLRRRRRQEMFTYIVVVYVSFLVFLVVIAALEFVLIPSLPDVGALGNGATTSAAIGGFGGGDREAYRLVFFHTALIQSTLSGLVAGVMGGGTIRDGAKHATIMVSITYVVLALLA